MRGKIRKVSGDWEYDSPCGEGVITYSWQNAMEAFWGHEIMCHSKCPDCKGTGCTECATRTRHDENWCYCVFCKSMGVVCSTSSPC